MSDQNTEPGQKLHGLDMNNPEHCWACLKAERDRYKEALEYVFKHTEPPFVTRPWVNDVHKVAQQALEGGEK